MQVFSSHQKRISMGRSRGTCLSEQNIRRPKAKLRVGLYLGSYFEIRKGRKKDAQRDLYLMECSLNIMNHSRR